jgi:hypothetical protein
VYDVTASPSARPGISSAVFSEALASDCPSERRRMKLDTVGTPFFVKGMDIDRRIRPSPKRRVANTMSATARATPPERAAITAVSVQPEADSSGVAAGAWGGRKVGGVLDSVVEPCSVGTGVRGNARQSRLGPGCRSRDGEAAPAGWTPTKNDASRIAIAARRGLASSSGRLVLWRVEWCRR